MKPGMLTVVLWGLLALFSAGSFGAALYFRQVTRAYQAELATARVAELVEPERAVVSEPVDEPDWRGRLRELEETLAEREAQLAALQEEPQPAEDWQPMATPTTATAAESERPERERPERRDRMAELRENDPERYEQMMEQRAAFRQRVQDGFARQTAHFLYRDRDHMSAEEQQTYDYMLGLLGETWQLADRAQDAELSREERREMSQRLMQNTRELRPLLAEQRDREFHQMALQLGYDNTGAVEFVDYINEMIDMTTLSGPWMGRRGRRGPER